MTGEIVPLVGFFGGILGESTQQLRVAEADERPMIPKFLDPSVGRLRRFRWNHRLLSRPLQSLIL